MTVQFANKHPRRDNLDDLVAIGVVFGAFCGVCMAAHKGWMDPKAITLTARLWSAFIAAAVAGIPFAFVGGIVGGIAIVVAPPAMAAVFILWVLYSVGAID